MQSINNIQSINNNTNNMQSIDYYDVYQKLLLKQSYLNNYLNMLENKIETASLFQKKKDEITLDEKESLSSDETEYQEIYLEYLMLLDEIILYRNIISSEEK